jgi:Holliday junction resolvase-like predicted endonuclease
VLLICPQILRSRGCGQVDLASFSSDGEVTLWEVKSITRYHDAGWMELIKKNQLTRLRRSIEFLSQVLENSVNIRIIGVGKTGKKRFLL